jgi:Zn-dependent protease with chaperone function
MKRYINGNGRTHQFFAPLAFLGIPVFVDRDSDAMAEARGMLWRKRIVVGRAFFNLTLREQDAVLSHEAGHLHKHHFARRLLAVPLLFLRPALAQSIAVKHELEADRFCAERGLAPELLSVLAKLPHGGRFYPQWEVRLAALRKFTEAR